MSRKYANLLTGHTPFQPITGDKHLDKTQWGGSIWDFKMKNQ